MANQRWMRHPIRHGETQLGLVRPMRVFPSMPAAIVTGTVGMPLLIWGWNFIETSSHSQLLLLLWAIVALIIPVVLATTDLRDIARRWREAVFFGSGSVPASRETAARKAVELQPTAAGSHRWQVFVAIERGDGEGALREAKLEPNERYRHFELALAHYARGGPPRGGRRSG
jgi:hypothetical protein